MDVFVFIKNELEPRTDLQTLDRVYNFGEIICKLIFEHDFLKFGSKSHGYYFRTSYLEV